ncbi:hypothetical protein IFO70_38525 [Phormidium tenue FACHB-886]|nr:hypothetical protein [Phormidium tenue FACHB-886]
MGSASRYWQLVRLTGAGQRRVDEITSAKTFFQQQFAELVDQSDVADPAIQRTLINLLRSPNTAALGDLAERCLRCLISHQIEQVCVQLAAKFGDRHGFTCTDLLPFVLDDGVQLMSQSLLQNQRQNNIPNQYRPLAAEILQTFDPNRASLNTWVMRQVRHHRELRAFLREHGVYLATDWGILNDTSPEQMRRIFTEFHRLSATEITLAYQLLRGYHEVYRSDRLQQRQQQIIRGKEACPPPTPDQLSRIAQFLQTQSITLSPPAILSSLQTIASQLRQYRLHRLGTRIK